MGISINEPPRAPSITVVMNEYEINNVIDKVSHHRIITKGTDSSAANTFLLRSASFDDGGYWDFSLQPCLRMVC